MSDRRLNRTIKVDMLARVEGEGGLDIRIRHGKLADVQFRIFEPPRLFEAFLRGRDFREAPDITARICGICPVAYQMSSVQAMEAACGVTVDGPLRLLRRLLYCGEWIESHALHVYLLHAPDFLGYESGVHMAKDHGPVVAKGLELKKTGNALVTLIGGREIHPINVRVGGFYRVPSKRELRDLAGPLEKALEIAVETVKLVKTFDFPEFDRDYTFVALRHAQEYAIDQGRVVSSAGLDIPVADYEKHFSEDHVERSNALHSTHRGHGPYHVGPLARFNLNHDRLPAHLQKMAREAGLGPLVRNPFQSIVVRAIETVYAVEEALRLIEAYETPDAPAVPVEPREGTGWGATEAPRGMLYHRYRLAADGGILDARITPPTSQNQKVMEEDLWRFVEKRLDLDDRTLTWQCEQAIRNYDPCISCATHFLKLNVTRE